MTLRSIALGLCLALTILAGSSAAQPAAAKPMPILTLGGTTWRYLETWQTETVRQDAGGLARVDPMNSRTRPDAAGNPGGATPGAGALRYDLLTTKTVRGSAWPAADWIKPDFDDTGWRRQSGPTRTQYRAIALMCLRGKFTVADPARAPDLALSVAFHGGMVVYLNGQEVARGGLPSGALALDTPADDYPKDCFLDADGSMLRHTTEVCNIMSDAEVGRLKDADTAARLKKRTRRLDVVLPAKLLRKGVNVLAIEVHRAPAIPEMFTRIMDAANGRTEPAWRAARWWNRVSIDELRLEAPTAPGVAGGIAPNTSRPKGVQVWNQDAMDDVNYLQYADPTEPLGPIRLRGARNGTYSGEVVISATEALTAVKAVAGDLRGPGGAVIPAAAVQVRYWRKAWQGWVYYPPGNWMHFDALDPQAPADVPLDIKGDSPLALKPIWVTVTIPRDAAPGEYTGTVTVQAKELPRAVEVPVQLHVSDWALPDARDFKTYVAMPQSPDTLSLQYNVPMWSEEHWKLIEKSFALMAQVGAKDAYIPVVRKSHLGNEHGMVRWVRQPGGGYQCDFSIVERYLDLAMKHLGKLPTVCFLMLETGPAHAQGLAYTEMEPGTKELKEATGPKWGTPEAAALLQPFFTGLRAVLAKRGLEKSPAIGMHIWGGAAGPRGSDQAYQTVKAAGGPDTRFFRVSHYWFGDREYGPDNPKWRCICLVGGVIGVFWDPDLDKPIYGWQNPELMLAYPRTTNLDYAGARLGQDSFLPEYRLSAEAVLTSGRRHSIGTGMRGNIAGEVGYDKFLGVRGFGPLGADFWPVLKGAKGDKSILGRYEGGPEAGTWSTISLTQVVPYLMHPGKDGPITSARFEMLREALQEAEARILVQNAILDEGGKARLGPDLTRKCKELCDDRTRALHYVSEFWSLIIVQDGDCRPELIFSRQWQDRSQALYDLAAEVSKALKK